MKEKIPKALREQVWIARVGKKFESKCLTPWCTNTMTVFDFQSGHNVPESKGGATDIKNLYPICSRCNLSMGDRYTFDEWGVISKPSSKWKLFKQFIKSKLWSKPPSATKEDGTKSPPNNTSLRGKHFKFRGILSANPSLPKKKPIERGIRKSKKL